MKQQRSFLFSLSLHHAKAALFGRLNIILTAEQRQDSATFDVLSAMLLDVQIFWDVTLCRWASTFDVSKDLLHTSSGSSSPC
jgi:hypothetical protein